MTTTYIAQIDKITRKVFAVVEMSNPIAAPPSGVEFVVIDSLAFPNKYYVNGVFQGEPPAPPTQP